MKKKVIVGLDFDGVVAYNPFRLVRAPWAYVKRTVLGRQKLTFYYPTNPVTRFIWKIMHDSSVFPAKGKELLIEMVDGGKIEVHLISGRFSFLDEQLFTWLDKYEMRRLFASVNWNRQDRQPHLFKEEMIEKLGIEYFVEDNWDIVKFLSEPKRNFRKKVRIFWIYNLLDRLRKYKYKYPYLEKALKEIK